MASFALAFGTATKNKDGKIIEAFFPTPVLNPSEALVSALADVVSYKDGNEVFDVEPSQCAAIASAFSAAEEQAAAAFATKATESNQPLVLVILATDEKPASVAEGFLKLQLISHRLAKPHTIVLDGIFGLLHNIAWTNQVQSTCQSWLSVKWKLA